MGGCLCVSSFLCSPLFASSLLPRPVQLALLRRSLRLRLWHQSPASSTRSSAHRLWARSTLGACAKPSASGLAVGNSATPTASDLHHTLTSPLGPVLLWAGLFHLG